MKKILCSREPWDSILGFNRPNGTSRTWNLLEDSKLDFPYTITEDFAVGSMKQSHAPHFTAYDSTKDFEDIEIHDIGDREHIYPIKVYNHRFFELNLNQGFSCISPKVLEDVKVGKAHICIECSTEGKYFQTPGLEFQVIDKWRKKADLPENSVIVFSGNLLCDEVVAQMGLGIKAVPTNGWHNFFRVPEKFSQNESIVEFNPVDENYLFLSFNRAPRNHRIELGYRFYDKKIIDKGKFSLNIKEWDGYITSIREEEIQKFKKLGNRIIDEPLSVDDKNLADNFNLPLYEGTFVSIISETLTDNNCIFFSEKIWKPISIGHPFFLVGSPKALQYLKKEGYKTFDKWWDESYDDTFSESERIIKITEEVEKLSKLSVDELKVIREEMQDILLHNKKLFQKTLKEVYKEDGLAEAWAPLLKEIFLTK
jgi:hypothetical protein